MPDFKKYIGLWIGPVVILELAVGLPVGWLEAEYLQPYQADSQGSPALVLVAAIAIAVLGLAGMVLQTLWFNDASYDRKPAIGESFRKCWRPLLPLVGTSFMLALVAAIAGVVVAIVVMIPNLFFADYRSVISSVGLVLAAIAVVGTMSATMFLPPVVVLEGDVGLRALKASWRLVRQRLVFFPCMFLVGWGPTLTVSFAAEMLPPGEPGTMQWANILLYFGASLWMGVFSGVYFYLYRQQRAQETSSATTAAEVES